jgi:transcriptional regulator with XRE-family HTH domain
MGKKPAKLSVNHLRAWREFNGLTQEELAAKVGTAGNVIGLLESGERGLSQKWLEKLAPHLKTRAGFLLEFDPHDIDRDMHELVAEMPKENKPLARDLLRSLKDRKAG